MFHVKPVYSYNEIIRGVGTCMAWEGIDWAREGHWTHPFTFTLCDEDRMTLDGQVLTLQDDRPDLMVLSIGEVRHEFTDEGEGHFWYVTLIVQSRMDDDEVAERKAARENRSAAGDGRAGYQAGSGDRRGQDLAATAKAQYLALGGSDLSGKVAD